MPAGRPFEESAWDSGPPPRGRPGPTRTPPLPSPRNRPRLLATLRRLQSLAAAPSGSGASPRRAAASGSQRRRQQQEEQPASGHDQAAGPASPRAEPRSRALEEPKEQLTRKQWRNRQKNRRRPKKNKFKAPPVQGSPEELGGRGPLATPAAEHPPSDRGGLAPEAEAASSRTQSLRRQHLESRLEAARFRFINQQLYTLSSQEAAQLFQEDPEALATYHRGFALQAARWPERPVQRFVRYLRRRPPSLVVADFGCGDCTLARSLPNPVVHCFDLLPLDRRVTVCDMAQVPLPAASVDVAVFCLALMGTNLREILQEAHRVLRAGGTLLVAEVASRFADVRAFVGALARLGFRLVSQDLSGSHFYTFELRRTEAEAASGEAGLALRPCLYKRR